MESWAFYDALLAVARKLGLRVRIEDLSKAGSSGGLCKLNGVHLILVDEGSTLAERIGSLVEALAQLDTEDVHMPPAIREILSERGDSRTPVRAEIRSQPPSSTDAAQPANPPRRPGLHSTRGRS